MQYRNNLVIFFVSLAGLYFCATFIHSMYYHATFNDLRNRVVGSRLAADGKNPYFYKYNATLDSTHLLDPYERREWIVNGNTITPTALLLTLPVHILPQSNINLIWLILSCIAFCSILFFLYNKQNIVPLLIGIALFVSGSWFLHLLKGQMYILYAVIAIAAIAAYAKKQTVIAIVLATLLVVFRPNSLILVVPLIISSLQYWKFWIAMFIIFIAAPMIVFNNYQIWGSYFSAMHWHGLENSHQIPEISVPTVSIPQTLEGWPTSTNASLLQIENNIQPDIASVQKMLVKASLPSTNFVLLSLLAIILAAFYFLVNGTKKIDFSKSTTILIAAIGFCISDYFLPAVRFNYNFVLILIPFAIVAIYELQVSTAATVLVFIGLFLQIKKLSWIPECYTVGEGFMLLSLLFIAKKNINNLD